MSHKKGVLITKYLRSVYMPDVYKLFRVTNMLPTYNAMKFRFGCDDSKNMKMVAEKMTGMTFCDEWAFQQCRKLDTIPFNVWCLGEFTSESGMYIFIPRDIDMTMSTEEISKKYIYLDTDIPYIER